VLNPDAGLPGAEIISIGNEVLSGLIQDGNSRFLGERLLSLGVAVQRATVVGDDAESITQALDEALKRVDWVVITGGLGTTHDDITKPVLAGYFHSGYRHDAAVAAGLEQFYKDRGRAVPEAVLGQCEVPETAAVLINEKGTAPGLLFEKDGKRVAALPGVPLEMRHLFEKYLVPMLAPLAGLRVSHRILHTTGVTEAGLWEKVGPPGALKDVVTVASLPSHLGVRIRLSAAGASDTEVNEKLNAAEAWFRQRAGGWIYATDTDTLENTVGRLLIEKKLTLAVAESCTGGLIGHRITGVPGSSEYFLEGAVTYSNAAKAARLGVPVEMLKRFGAVSEETARTMAEGIRRSAAANIGLAVTGIAGPGGGSGEKPVGLTFIALADAAGTVCERFIFHQDRRRNKERAAQAALDLLRLRLTDGGR
jgi:nicotinamide-nucleotide amidase